MIPLDVIRNFFTKCDAVDPGIVASNLATRAAAANLAASYTWDGTTVVLSADTSAVIAGDWIRLNSDGKWFEVTSVNANVSVTILNPTGATIPTGTGAAASAEITTPDAIPLPGGLYKIAAMTASLQWMLSDNNIMSATPITGSFLAANDQEVIIVPPSGGNFTFAVSNGGTDNGFVNIVPVIVSDVPKGDLRSYN